MGLRKFALARFRRPGTAADATNAERNVRRDGMVYEQAAIFQVELELPNNS
jgi:hypothetical protein